MTDAEKIEWLTAVNKALMESQELWAAEIKKLRNIAYIGDHHFPDLTWKARFEELFEDNKNLKAEIEQLREDLVREQEASANGWKAADTEHNRAMTYMNDLMGANHEIECLQQARIKAEEERDERSRFAAAETEHANRWAGRAHSAEAEVQRLKTQMEHEAKDYTQDDVNQMTNEMITLRKKYEKIAFKRGAEAMREVALRACEEPQMGMESDMIRNLPIPEDKS
jgi:hypothetical protein